MRLNFRLKLGNEKKRAVNRRRSGSWVYIQKSPQRRLIDDDDGRRDLFFLECIAWHSLQAGLRFGHRYLFYLEKST